VFGLAKETGWSEEYILWELPFVRALEYYHAALISAGKWTIKYKSESEKKADLDNLLSEISQTFFDDEDDY
jgi:hypothetical protein